MYAAGDRVLYGIHGVCCVTALEERKVDRKMVTYLVLEPESQPGASYLVPAHNAVAMAKLCPILSREELERLMSSEEVHQGAWEPDENLRKALYRELLVSCDRIKLLQMIFFLYRHKEARLAVGKKFHQIDDSFLRDAEKMLCSEISYVMEMDQQQAKDYLREKLA